MSNSALRYQQNYPQSKKKTKNKTDFSQTTYIVPEKHEEERERKLKPLVAKNDHQRETLQAFSEKQMIIQTGSAGCVDADTEFLTPNGWKKISEYTDEDLVMQVDESFNGSFTKPYRYIKEPCLEFWKFKTKYGIDQVLSEDHSIGYVTPKVNTLRKMSVSDFLSKDKGAQGNLRIKKCYNYSGAKLELSEDMLRLGLALKCDGHLEKRTSTGYYTIRLKKERKIERFREILKALSYEYTEFHQERTGFVIFNLKAPWCTKSFSQWFNCSKEDAEILLAELVHWDGSKGVGNRLMRYSCCVEEDANTVQYWANICGYKADIKVFDRSGQPYKDSKYIRKNKEFIIQVSTQTDIALKPVKSKTTEINKIKSTDGFKYCFSVPTGYLVLRRNGSVFVTGNCGKTELACWWASKLWLEGKVDTIVITRPHKHLGDDYGAIRGSDAEKLLPFCMSILMKLKKQLGVGILRNNFKMNGFDDLFSDARGIMIVPVEKIQGLSYNNRTIIIADEIQNASISQVKALATRMEEGCQLLICGDPKQTAITGENGLVYLTKKLEKHPHELAQVITYTPKDNCRVGISAHMTRIFEEDGNW